VRLEPDRVVFELVWPDGLLHKSEALSELQVFVDGRLVHRGQALVSNVIHTPNKLTVEALLREQKGVVRLDDGGDGVPGAVRRLSQALDLTGQARRLPDEFRLAVTDLCQVLRGLQLWLDVEETRFTASRGTAVEGDESSFMPALATAASPALTSAFERLEHAQQRIEGSDWQLASAYLKRELHPLTLCAPFMHRTYTKPLGYAGDYEMVNMMVRPPYQGGSLYAKILNAFFLNTPPVVAHRARLDYLLTAIREEALRVHREGRPLRIYNLGCGPAWEVESFVAHSPLSTKAEFTLVDFSQETLDYATGQVTKTSATHQRAACVKGVKRSVAQLLKSSAGRTATPAIGTFDLVYCAGLFDYLPDSVCAELLKYLHSLMESAGRLIATNIQSSNPSRGWMESAVDWYLFHRSPEDLTRLLPVSADADEVSLVAEASGVNIFLDIRNN